VMVRLDRCTNPRPFKVRRIDTSEPVTWRRRSIRWGWHVRLGRWRLRVYALGEDLVAAEALTGGGRA
jgi:hypothetical protein